MIKSDYLSEEPVKYLCRKDCLPESDEVESERDAAESCIALDCAHDPLADIFGLKDRDDAGLYTVEHSGIDIIRSDCCDVYIALHLLKLDAH